MPQCCVVPLCSERKGGHRFPRDKRRLQIWLVAIRRENFTPSAHSRVCKKHFDDDAYELPKDSIKDNPTPVLKKDAVPSKFSWNTGSIELELEKKKNCSQRALIRSANRESQRVKTEAAECTPSIGAEVELTNPDFGAQSNLWKCCRKVTRDFRKTNHKFSVHTLMDTSSKPAETSPSEEGQRCVASGCQSVWSPECGVRFHGFPHDNSEVLKKWVDAVNLPNFKPSTTSYLCSKHFEVHCFWGTSNNRKLRKHAVPTIFRDLPDWDVDIQEIKLEEPDPLCLSPELAIPHEDDDIELKCTLDENGDVILTSKSLSSELKTSLEFHNYSGVPLRELCRLCCSSRHDNADPTYDICQDNISQMINKCFNLELVNNDVLSNFICHACFDKLTSFYFFSSTVREVNNFLNSKISFTAPSIVDSYTLKAKTATDKEDMNDRLIETVEIENEMESFRKRKGLQNKQTEESPLSLTDIPSSDDENNSADVFIPDVSNCDIAATSKNFPEDDTTIIEPEIVDPSLFTDFIIEESSDGYVCHVCDKKFKSVLWKLLHYSIEHAKYIVVYKCTYCKQAYTNSEQVINHFMKAHVIDFTKKVVISLAAKVKCLFECEFCFELFTTCSNLKNHKISCVAYKNKESKCPCGKVFTTASKFDMHFREHSNDTNMMRPKCNIFYQCDICDIMFHSACNMLYHVNNSHTFEKRLAIPRELQLHKSNLESKKPKSKRRKIIYLEEE